MGLKERRAKEKEARRNQILDAARALLFEKGLQATSINQIAKQAELGVGTIYIYYRSKEEIFAELQEEGLEILFARILKTSNQDFWRFMWQCRTGHQRMGSSFGIPGSSGRETDRAVTQARACSSVSAVPAV